MQCTTCHETILANTNGFVACPHCATVNIHTSEKIQQPIVMRGTVVSPVHIKQYGLLRGAKWWAAGITTLVIVVITGLGFNFVNQNSHAKADLSLAKRDIALGKYTEADTLLAKAGKLSRQDPTTQAIKQTQIQNKHWQSDAKKLAQAKQFVASGNLDGAITLLTGIDKAFPTYSKVTELQKSVQAQKAANAQKLAAAQVTPVPLPQPPAPVQKAAQVSKPQSAVPASFSTQIQIRGDATCQSDTLAALQLLSSKAPSHYATITQYMGIIECASQGSGMFAYENPPRYVVGDATRNAGTVWYAGTIAHDAGHSKLYHEYLASHPGQPVPDDIWTGKSAEITCLAAQSDALSKIGGTQSQLDYLQNVINTQYYNVPYDQRWW